MTKPLRFALMFIAIAAFLAAVLIRMPGLEARPFHTDEANNAFILEETLKQGRFNYRTQDHHGPSLFWLSALPLKIAGIQSTAEMEPWMLRGIAVLCSSAAAAAVFLLVPFIPLPAASVTAVFLILAAPFHYYGRTYIHESLLLLLTLLFLAALLRWRDSGRILCAVLTGVAVGLMVITKENAAVTVILLGLPFLIPVKGSRKWLSVSGVTLSLVAAALLLVFALGWENLQQALFRHVDRGFNSGHSWPWWQYLFWFVSASGPGLPWSAWIALALSGVAVGHWRKFSLSLPLGLGFVALALFHSLLPYKTPWLMVGMGLPLVLLAGLGGAALIDTFPRRFWIPLAALGIGLLFSETWLRSFHNEVAAHNPMAYSPTDLESQKLVQAVDAFAATQPKGKELTVQVVGADYWPLPWLLRHYPNKGFWNEAPSQWPGEVLVCTPEAFGWVPEPQDWNFTPYALRPGVLVFVGLPKIESKK